MTPRQAWNEACDELERAAKVAMTLARIRPALRACGAEEEVIKHMDDRVAAAWALYYEAKEVAETAALRMRRAMEEEVREAYGRECEETT